MVAIEAVDRLANCKQLDAEKLAAIKPKLMKKLDEADGLLTSVHAESLVTLR